MTTPSFSPLRDVRVFKLSNGLRVCLKQVPAWPVVSVQGWVGVGSIDEDEAHSGLSHVLEHMVFKGTRRRRAAEISRWVEAQGGSLNAETSKEYTHYYIDVPSEGTQTAIRLMGELLCEATLEDSEWARECPVILEEIKRRKDDPDAQLWDIFNDALFDDDRWKRPVIGSPATVQSVSSAELRHFYKSHYTVDRCVLSVVGDFEPAQVRAWLETAFSRMPARGAARTPRTTLAAALEPRRATLQKSVQQAYTAFGFCTPPALDTDHDALDLLAAILGDGRRSRLVHTLREEKKLVWSIGASNLTHEGPGLFGIFAECDLSKLPLVTAALEQEWKALRAAPPSTLEIQRAKNLMQTSWWQSFETVHSQASMFGLFSLEHQLERLESYWRRIDALTRDDLRDIIARYFQAPMGSAFITA